MSNTLHTHKLARSILEYCELNSTFPSLSVASIRSKTTWHPRAHMMLPNSVANLIAILVRSYRPRQCLEIGAFTGHMTALIAGALTDGSTLIALEEYPEIFRLLEENIHAYNLSLRARVILGEGFSWLAKTDITFDFILLDGNYSGAITQPC